ncbi:hypothetical protein A8C56_04765 [Niabella ginsenosidivorans]|uniref:Pvc16 N-terminal domain-containing protein n=1 Tax=Niabella ginsenosidivorans TaxID=1176587 RepID=A0A1A9I1E6_9BACT|nr:DUF4255 domain-containing protein [Niabella ginsenosidivorans]ANH80384.1 hypothetical protein A8C56_04765 [Niabella ginsenosidivorans]
MSSALAIAGITQVLKDLLNDGIINNITTATGTTVTVTALPPDKIEDAGEQTQLNLYMYQATVNQGWRNEGLPVFTPRGDRVSNPPLALDLHYLLSAYTGGAELHTEILLGYGMQLLHENPVLTRDAINKSLSPPDHVDLDGLPPVLRALATTGLADQVEQITITPEVLNADEISKLWTAFTTKYRPTAAYKVTVVLIQSVKSTRKAPPVQSRNIYVIPFNEPVVEEIEPVPATGEPSLPQQLVFSESDLILKGKRLWNDTVMINISGIQFPVMGMGVTGTTIQLKLPEGLKAGLQSLQVIHPVAMGTPPAAHNGVCSKVQAFILSPLVIDNPIATGTAPEGKFKGSIKVKIKPMVTARQEVQLILNGLPPATGAYTFSYVAADKNGPPVDELTIPVSNVAPGTYLVRVQVDGAESPLETDNSTKTYNSPAITIT